MIKRGLAFGLLLLFVQSGSAQIDKANKYFSEFQFEEAIPLYLRAIKKGQDSAAVINLAESYRQIHDYTKAEVYYKRAAELFPNNADVQLKYGQILKSNSKLEEAKEVFVVYANANPTDAEGQSFLLSCDRVRSWSVQTPGYEVENKDDLNTELSDFSPVPFGNGVAFVSDRYTESSDATGSQEGGYLSIAFSEMNTDSSFKRAKPISNIINDEFHNGPICFSHDQSEAYFTRVGYNRKKGKDFVSKPQIFVSKREGEKWGKPQPFQHNDDNYAFSQPALSPDGKTLYFASDMPGTIGGLDIFSCEKDGAGWSAPENTGDIVNTKGNEMFPTVTEEALYFSSDGHLGIGALDIFKAKIIDEGWGQVENLKEPINSPRDDFGLVFTDEKNGFFSSNREGGKGGDDIYGFTLKQKIGEETEITGVFIYSELEPAINAVVKLYDEDGNMIMETLTDEQGAFKFIGLEADKNYTFRMDEDDPKLTDFSQVFLTNKEGERIVALSQPTMGEFHFRALQSEQIEELQPIVEEDVQLRFVDIFGQVYEKLPGDYQEGMEVYLVNDEGEIVYTTFADENGRFEFTNILSDKDYKIQLANDTSDVQMIYINEDGDKLGDAMKTDNGNFIFLTQDITDPETSSVFGKIYQELPGDYTGGMEVYLVNDEGEIVYTTLADANGEFNFENLPPDQHYAIKLKEMDSEYKILMLDEQGDPQEVLKQTEEGDYQYQEIAEDDNSLFGKVYETLPGDYSAGMEVYLVNEDGEIVYTTNLDKDGNFNFENLPPDHNFKVRLQQTGDDLNMIVLNEFGEVESKAKQTVEGDFEYERTEGSDKTGLFGNIFKELPGDFSAGLEVYLVDDDGNIVYKTVTDEDGNFNFENLPPDHNFKIKLKGEEDDFQMVVLDDQGELKPATETENGYILEQQERRNLLGNVYQTLPGDYTAGMEVYLLDDAGNIVFKTKTDENGNFAFENLPADKHYLVQIKDAPEDINMVMLNDDGEMLSSAKSTGDGVFETDPPQPENESIFGKAYQELPGDYTAGMEVYLVDDEGNIVYTTTTDENGDFVFENLPADKHFVIKFNEEDTQMKVLFMDEAGDQVGSATAGAGGDFEYNYLNQKKEYISLLTANDAIIKIIDDADFVVFSVQFDYDKSNVASGAREELNTLAKMMQRNPHIQAKINAYADSKGAEDYNLKLSQRRAEEAKDYVVKCGVEANRIEAKGHGEDKPIAPNTLPDGSDNPQGRAMNRRAEVQISRNN